MPTIPTSTTCTTSLRTSACRSGSTRVGPNCRIGGAAMISGHLTIAAGVTISGGTTVFGNIDAPGVYTGAFPTMPYRDWQKAAAQLRQLARLRRRLVTLERAVARKGEDDAAGAIEEGSR